jgi:hypothetical protein
LIFFGRPTMISCYCMSLSTIVSRLKLSGIVKFHIKGSNIVSAPGSFSASFIFYQKASRDHMHTTAVQCSV